MLICLRVSRNWTRSGCHLVQLSEAVGILKDPKRLSMLRVFSSDTILVAVPYCDVLCIMRSTLSF